MGFTNTCGSGILDNGNINYPDLSALDELNDLKEDEDLRNYIKELISHIIDIYCLIKPSIKKIIDIDNHTQRIDYKTLKTIKEGNKVNFDTNTLDKLLDEALIYLNAPDDLGQIKLLKITHETWKKISGLIKGYKLYNTLQVYHLKFGVSNKQKDIVLTLLQFLEILIHENSITLPIKITELEKYLKPYVQSSTSTLGHELVSDTTNNEINYKTFGPQYQGRKPSNQEIPALGKEEREKRDEENIEKLIAYNMEHIEKEGSGDHDTNAYWHKYS
jgi:hypothetical protein